MLQIVSVLGLLSFLFTMNLEPSVPTTQSSKAYSCSPIGNDTIPILNLPERRKDAWSGTEFARQIESLSRIEREKAVVEAILSGNVPTFSKTLKPVEVTEVIDGKAYTLLLFVTADYMAIGSDDDYLYVPLTPLAAQYLASKLNCVLPTKKVIDTIYHQAGLKLTPQPIAPSDSMTTVPVFVQHTDSIKQQIRALKLVRSGDQMVAGHKKDVIISNKIYGKDRAAGSVVIYGWHLGENEPIQPVYNGHHARYADYSHGIRLVAQTAFLRGDPIRVDRLLRDKRLSVLLSQEGVIRKPHYPEVDFFR